MLTLCNILIHLEQSGPDEGFNLMFYIIFKKLNKVVLIKAGLFIMFSLIHSEKSRPDDAGFILRICTRNERLQKILYLG